MGADFITDFSKRLKENEIADEQSPIVKCTDAEIAKLEKKAKVKFPKIYREYLTTMGRQAGEFLRGEEHSYPDLLTLRADATELLEESETNFRLSPTDFVFWMSEGTQFLFFDTAAGDDPPVLHYREDDKAPVQRWYHYSEALTQMLQEQIKIRKSLLRKK